MNRPIQNRVDATAHVAELEAKYAKAYKAYCMEMGKLEQEQQDHAKREAEDPAKAKEVYESTVRLVKSAAKECNEDQKARLVKVEAKRKLLRDEYEEKKTRALDTLQKLGGIDQGCAPLQSLAAVARVAAKPVSVVTSDRFSAEDLSACMMQNTTLKTSTHRLQNRQRTFSSST